MPDKEELEQWLDAWEISRLEQMDDAAKIMDAHDEEVSHGNKDAAPSMG